jgi:hypothetical protein
MWSVKSLPVWASIYQGDSMDFNELKWIIELIEKLGNSKSEPSSKKMIGQYVIIRCKDAGVHAGTLESYNNGEVVLLNSRRLWQWKAKQGHSLSAVAKYGIEGKESKLPCNVNELVLFDVCEIITTTKDCKKSIEDCDEYKPK